MPRLTDEPQPHATPDATQLWAPVTSVHIVKSPITLQSSTAHEASRASTLAIVLPALTIPPLLTSDERVMLPKPLAMLPAVHVPGNATQSAWFETVGSEQVPPNLLTVLIPVAWGEAEVSTVPSAPPGK